MPKKLAIGTIALRFTFPNGWTGRYEFRSLGAARRFAQQKMGAHPDIGSTYAVNRQGDMTLRVTGTSLTELFPEAGPEAAPAPSLAVPRGLTALHRRLAAAGFGGRSAATERVPITLYAVNGKRYVGTYYSGAGTYARVRLAKG